VTCADDLAEARRELAEVTRERDQLLVIVDVTMHVMTPGQLAAVRNGIAEHDRGPRSAV
jgi:hypothetical protein